MVVCGQRHAPAALYSPGKDLRYSLDRGLVGLRADLDTEARAEVPKLLQLSPHLKSFINVCPPNPDKFK
jgi:hypothetical protein